MLHLKRCMFRRAGLGGVVLCLAASLITSCINNGNKPSPTAPQIISFSSSSPSVLAGQATTLSWSVQSPGAVTLTLSPQGTVEGSSIVVTPQTTTTYTLTASNTYGSTSAEVTVTAKEALSGIPGLVSEEEADAGKYSYIPIKDTDQYIQELTFTSTGAETNLTVTSNNPDVVPNDKEHLRLENITSGQARQSGLFETHYRLLVIPLNHRTGDVTLTFNHREIDTLRVSKLFLHVTAENQAPVATPQEISIQEEETISITLSGEDLNGGALSYHIKTEPSHGVLGGLDNNQLTYTPKPDYTGEDSFTFIAFDGQIESQPAEIKITIARVNDPPIAKAQALGILEDRPLSITLESEDHDSQTITYWIATPPSNGKLSDITGTQVTYTPNQDYFGEDSFTFVAHDETTDSEPAEVIIYIEPEADPPLAQPQTLTTLEDHPLTITLSGTDADGDSLNYSIATKPQHGTLSAVTGDQVTYTPDADFTGEDSFSFTANDSLHASEPQTVKIMVGAEEDPPIALEQEKSTPEDTPITLTLLGQDIDNDPLSYSIATQPQHGTLSNITDNQVTYTPNANYNGQDSFTFTVSDGILDSQPATVTLTITAENDPPNISDQSVTGQEDTPFSITLGGTDGDGDTLAYRISSPPEHGTLGSVEGQAVMYTPVENFFGEDAFSVIASDGTTDSAPARVALTIMSQNDAPMAKADTLAIVEDEVANFRLEGSDVDGDTLSYVVTATTEHGVLEQYAPNDNRMTYTPNANYTGKDIFTFTVSDGQLTSEPATFEIIISAEEDAPVALDATASTPEDEPVTITLEGVDADNDDLSYHIATQPSHGTLSEIAERKVIYTPETDFNGEDSFSFTVSDGLLPSDPAFVSITVMSVNDLPIASPQQVSTDDKTPLKITLAAKDSDSDSVTYQIVDTPTSGSLSTLNQATVIYTPKVGFEGKDSFSFKASDGEGESAPATVEITVSVAVPDTIVAKRIELAQSHVLPPEGRKWTLNGKEYGFHMVGNREALVMVGFEGEVTAPYVKGKVKGQSVGPITLNPPDKLPITESDGPTYRDDAYSAMIPKEWLVPGLSISFGAEGLQESESVAVKVGADTIFDMYILPFYLFGAGSNLVSLEEAQDMNQKTKDELFAKWPIAELNTITHPIEKVEWDYLIGAPGSSDGKRHEAYIMEKVEDIKGGFDPINTVVDTVIAMRKANGLFPTANQHYSPIIMQDANGKYYLSGGGIGLEHVGAGDHLFAGIFFHEQGHAFDLGHAAGVFSKGEYPYVGGSLLGSTWGFDSIRSMFHAPFVPSNANSYAQCRTQTYDNFPRQIDDQDRCVKQDPMQSGSGDQNQGDSYTMLSDFYAGRIQNYFEGEDAESGRLFKQGPYLSDYKYWDPTSSVYVAADLTKGRGLNGIEFNLPIETDVPVYTIVVTISYSRTPGITQIYPILSQTGNLIATIDPRDPVALQDINPDYTLNGQYYWYCEASGCDYTLKVTYSDGSVLFKVFPAGFRDWFGASREPSANVLDPYDRKSYKILAMNVPAQNTITKVELLETPMVWNGLPENPPVLATRTVP